MASRTLSLSQHLARPARTAIRSFHSTRPALLKVGDKLPDLEVLMEGSPGNKVNLAKEAQKNKSMILLGVPAAFSPACSSSHVPSYAKHPRAKEFDSVAVVSINDAFVMKAWGESLDPKGQTGIRFLADPTGAFTKALDLTFDGSAIFGGDRSKRYTLIIRDGTIEAAHVEPDNTGTAVSLADQVLGKQ